MAGGIKGGYMQLKTGSFLEMAKDIISHKSKIVLFGAGVIGTSTTPAVLAEYGLLDALVCYIDNDKSKWEEDI